MTADRIEIARGVHAPDRLVPGVVIEIETPAGRRHIQLTHSRAPYPSVFRALAPKPDGESGKLEERPTAFSAMAELAGAMARGDLRGRILDVAPLPKGAERFPTFRLPIRDGAGGIAYWWLWDDDGLRIDPDAGTSDLPLREVMSIKTLIARLAAL